MPLVLLLATFIGGVDTLTHPIFEWVIMPIAIVIAGIVIYKDFSKHAQLSPFVLLMIGIGVLAVSYIAHIHVLSAIGALFIAGAQLINWRLHKRYGHCGHAH